MPRFFITPTARNHIRVAINETRNKWGTTQAAIYRQKLEKGLQYVAENHRTFRSHHRMKLAEGTQFSLHLVEHHYVAFQEHDENIIITGVFHESMDIPSQLKELAAITLHEIEALKRAL